MGNMSHWGLWLGAAVMGAVGLVAGVVVYRSGRIDTYADDSAARDIVIPVRTTRPLKGMERTSRQNGSIQAYESVRLYAKVPGFLKE